jgi:hypothetical protein
LATSSAFYSHALIKTKFFQNQLNLFLQVARHCRLDADGEVDSDAKAIAGSKFREDFRTETVPDFGRHVPN